MARKGAEKMTAKEFMDFLHILERMKCNTRHGWTSTGRRESVAEHSYRLCAMAFLLRDEFPELDMGKVLDMCIVHDWGEAVTGDIPSFLKTDADEAAETDAVGGLTARLPDKKGKLDALFAELLALETPEAKLYKALDRIEAVIQHNEAPLETWIELERTLNLEYGVEDCAAFPFMSELREAFHRALAGKVDEFIVPTDAHLYVAYGSALIAGEPDGIDVDGVHFEPRTCDDIIAALDGLKNLPANTPTMPPLFSSDQEREAFNERHHREHIHIGTLEGAKGPHFLGLNAG